MKTKDLLTECPASAGLVSGGNPGHSGYGHIHFDVFVQTFLPTIMRRGGSRIPPEIQTELDSGKDIISLKYFKDARILYTLWDYPTNVDSTSVVKHSTLTNLAFMMPWPDEVETKFISVGNGTFLTLELYFPKNIWPYKIMHIITHVDRSLFHEI